MFSSRVLALSQESQKEKHIEVAMRMIGHKVLRASNDSTSRVLPIIKEDDGYRIQFESEFEFATDSLINIVTEVFDKGELGKSYIVEVVKCSGDEVIYSFEIDRFDQENIVPCKSRVQEKACYNILLTFIDRFDAQAELYIHPSKMEEAHADSNALKYVLALLILLLVTIAFIYFRNKKRKSRIDPDLISLGEYLFNKRKTELLIKDQKIELTGKEADLLLLLYNGANTTVERDVILNMVWGDEGDYVGRTLDVFISKLRKKLEFDSKVKIVNIRGVGYKLVLDA